MGWSGAQIQLRLHNEFKAYEKYKKPLPYSTSPKRMRKSGNVVVIWILTKIFCKKKKFMLMREAVVSKWKTKFVFDWNTGDINCRVTSNLQGQWWGEDLPRKAKGEQEAAGNFTDLFASLWSAAESFFPFTFFAGFCEAGFLIWGVLSSSSSRFLFIEVSFQKFKVILNMSNSTVVSL